MRVADRLGAGTLLAGVLVWAAGCAPQPDHAAAGRPANAEVLFITRGSLDGHIEPTG